MKRSPDEDDLKKFWKLVGGLSIALIVLIVLDLLIYNLGNFFKNRNTTPVSAVMTEQQKKDVLDNLRPDANPAPLNASTTQASLAIIKKYANIPATKLTDAQKADILDSLGR